MVGMEALEHVPAGVELQLRRVVVVGRPHRAHDRDIVDAAARFGHQSLISMPLWPCFLKPTCSGVELVHQRARACRRSPVTFLR